MSDERRVTVMKVLGEAIALALIAVAFGAIAYRIYLRETTGVDPWQTIFAFVYVENASISIPASIGLLFLALFLGWMRFVRGGKFGIKPFLLVAAILTLAIFGWVQTNDL